MSFPSAPHFLANGLNPEEALFNAFKRDTPEGFAYVQALAAAVNETPDDATVFVRSRVPDECQKHILRHESLAAGGIKVDVDPNSKIGGQVLRLLGTDVARGILEKYFHVAFGLANCCAGAGGKDKSKVQFSAEDQIRWQNSLDC